MMISMPPGLPGKEGRDIVSRSPHQHLPLLAQGHHGDKDTMTSQRDYSARTHRVWPAYRSSPEHPLQTITVQQVIQAGRSHSEEQPADSCHPLLNIHPLSTLTISPRSLSPIPPPSMPWAWLKLPPTFPASTTVLAGPCSQTFGLQGWFHQPSHSGMPHQDLPGKDILLSLAAVRVEVQLLQLGGVADRTAWQLRVTASLVLSVCQGLASVLVGCQPGDWIVRVRQMKTIGAEWQPGHSIIWDSCKHFMSFMSS